MQKITRKNMHPFLGKYATNEMVTDIGSGRVSREDAYNKYFPNRLTVDIDPENKPDIVADIHALPFENDSQNVVVCMEVIEHCHSPQEAVNEIHRVLKPGGLCILTTRFMFPIHNYPHDYWRFTEMQMAKLFQKWNVVELRPETKTMSAVGAILQRITFQVRFRFANRPIKFILLVLAWIFDHSNSLIKAEYGDITHKQSIQNVFSTGYYIVAKKI